MTALPADGAVAGFAARRPLILGFVTLALLGGGLFGWGAFASIAGAVIATGRVEVETRDQVVEHIDGGTVGEVLVRNGDRVNAGDVLIRLDDTLLRSEEAVLEGEYLELVARRNRLEAEFGDADAIAWDPALALRAAEDAAVRTITEGQRRLFEARRAGRAGHVAQLHERVRQARKQIASLQAQRRAVKRQREFLSRELEVQRELFDQKLTQLHLLLELEREAARLDGQAGDIEARIAGARSRIAEIEIQILQIGTRRIEEAESEAREAQARENEVHERLTAVRERLDRMDVRAPVAGEIFDMQVFARHEVVRPGEPIAYIVPAGTELVVRAQLEPIHVDQVHPGQDAVLLFSAFPARTTPEFEGRILRVAADATHDERTGLSWYEVEVEMGSAIRPEAEMAIEAWATGAWEAVEDWLPEVPDEWRPDGESVPAWLREILSVGDGGPSAGPGTGKSSAPGPGESSPLPPEIPEHARDLALSPGMPVEVHIRTGERSPLSYLAKPLTDYFARSLREE